MRNRCVNFYVPMMECKGKIFGDGFVGNIKDAIRLSVDNW